MKYVIGCLLDAIKTTGQAGNIFGDIETEFGPPNNGLGRLPLDFMQNREHIDPNPIYPSFATARGSHIPVSSTLLSKQTNIFQNVKVTEDELKTMNNWIDDNGRNNDTNINGFLNASVLGESRDLNPIPNYAGFSTARGSHIAVSSALMSKKKNIFQNVEITEEELKKMDNWIGSNERDSILSKRSITDVNANATASFSTANGRHIPVSSTLISTKKNIFQDVEITEDELKKMDYWIDDNVRDGNIKINRLSESYAMEPVSKSSRTDANSNATASFSTVSGRHIPVSSAQISKSLKIFQATDVELGYGEGTDWLPSNNSAEGPDSKEIRTTTITKPFAGFCSGWGREIPVSMSLISKSADVFDDEKMNPLSSTECFREVTNSLNHPQTDVVNKRNKLPVNTFTKPSPLRKMSMVNSLRKLETESAKENVDAQSNSLLDFSDNANPTSIIHTSSLSMASICVTPINKPKTYTQEIRDGAAGIFEDNESCDLSPGFIPFEDMAEAAASSTPIRKIDNYQNRSRQRRLVERFDDIAGEVFSNSTVSSTANVQVSPSIISLRKRAFEVQCQSISKKTNIRPVPSSLFVRKLASTQIKWKEYVENTRPANRLVLPKNISKSADNVLRVTTENAIKFKFNASDHYSDELCRENVNGIHLSDDIVVIMDDNCQIGLNEISTAFLSCPSVDQNLIHDKWIENHFKWSVTKLAGMECSFPTQFAGNVLTLENLMLQLKYRYDREVDQAQRSAIRKICEMDDTPAKRMILFVASSSEVELSDGWYSLLSTLDQEMTRFVERGKIKVGTKLVIQDASIVGLDGGCYPLDVSLLIVLKHKNLNTT